MKPLAPILGFVIGIIVAAVTCSVHNSVHEATRSVQLLSDVHDPLRQCLDDIAQTHDRGDVSLAQQKTRLLQQRWSQYLDGSGRSPESFASEIIDLEPAVTQPAR